MIGSAVTRILILVGIPWLAHAQAHIDGVWKTDPQSFTSPTKPAVVTGKSDGNDPDYRYVLMPIRSAG